jgi:hypothetical protein
MLTALGAVLTCFAMSAINRQHSETLLPLAELG